MTIEVEDAIKALVTKSANDVAVVVAENLGGSEEAFAEQMTRKARALGMSRTVYRNASGLPDPEQVTTARDLTDPRHGRSRTASRGTTAYFQTRVFNYGRRSHPQPQQAPRPGRGRGRHQDRLYRASGFNLMTSVRTDDRTSSRWCSAAAPAPAATRSWRRSSAEPAARLCGRAHRPAGRRGLAPPWSPRLRRPRPVDGSARRRR